MTPTVIPQGPSDSPLQLTVLSGERTHARWRTEAMRSHSTARLLIFLRGRGRIVVHGQSRDVLPRDLVFLPARTHYGIAATATVFAQVLTLPRSMAEDWPTDLTQVRLGDDGSWQELRDLLDALQRELSRQGPLARHAAACHAGLMSIFLHRQAEMKCVSVLKPGPETSPARIAARFGDLVDRDFARVTRIADYAAALGITPTHLTRCCKAARGRSASALLSDRRHDEACRLLCETRLPLACIASKVGFGSPAYFSRVFHGRTGQTPSRFRQVNRDTAVSDPSHS